MVRLKGLIERGLAATADQWPAIRLAFGWVHRAADILGQDEVSGTQVRSQLGGLLGAMRRHRVSAGPLAGGVDHFVKVSRSYWPGLFACYDVVGLPRTNNDLEQAFGAFRYHERRVSGRKGASPSLVVRGSARLVAGLVTRYREVSVSELACADRAKWAQLRATLEERRTRRVERRRFRRDPYGFLENLERKLHQLRLPA